MQLMIKLEHTRALSQLEETNIGLDVTINRSIKWLLIECVKTVALSILVISTIALYSIYHTCLWRCGLCG